MLKLGLRTAGFLLIIIIFGILLFFALVYISIILRDGNK